jgi:hypothetical protein
MNLLYGLPSYLEDVLYAHSFPNGGTITPYAVHWMRLEFFFLFYSLIPGGFLLA